MYLDGNPKFYERDSDTTSLRSSRKVLARRTTGIRSSLINFGRNIVQKDRWIYKDPRGESLWHGAPRELWSIRRRLLKRRSLSNNWHLSLRE